MNEEDNINNKKKKRSELVAIELGEKESHFDKIIEEGIKILGLSQKEYDNTVDTANKRLTKTKKDIILEAGRYLENNLEIVRNNSPNEICKMLKARFKGTINPTTIWYICPEKWKVQGYATIGKIGGKNSRKRFNSSEGLNSINEETEPLTEYEKKYVKVHDDKVFHNENVVNLINYYLGMTEEEKTQVFSKAKRAGLEYHTALIDEAYNNMLRIVKSLNDADIPALLADIRFLKQIMTKVADIALHENDLRKRNKDLMKV